MAYVVVAIRFDHSLRIIMSKPNRKRTPTPAQERGMPHHPPDEFQQLHSRLTLIKVYTAEIAATVFFVAFVIYILVRELSGLFK
jgi:hypothetical protein